MPRANRIHVPGAFYLISTTGSHDNPIAGCTADWEHLNRLVDEALTRFDAWLHAFCWTRRRLYLFVQIGQEPLGRIMQQIKSNFALYQHRKAKRAAGHWFEQRYRAQIVDEMSYFRAVLRYIHLQPLAHRLAKDLANYRWSSYAAYLGQDKVMSRLCVERGLSLFHANPARARAACARFTKLPLARSSRLENPLPACTALDARILGSYEFQLKILRPTDKRIERNAQTLTLIAN